MWKGKGRKGKGMGACAILTFPLKKTLLNVSRNGTGTTYRHNYNGILIGAYTRPTQVCYFK